jgi:hypothetical protein
MKSTKKVTDLNEYLTKASGLDMKERVLWRSTILKVGKKDKVEAMRIFRSFEYFKQNYLNVTKRTVKK